MSGIFISYRREDSAPYARNLTAVLRKRIRRSHIFRDIETIGPGEDFAAAIEQAIDSCEAVVVLIGEKWLTLTDAGGRRRLDNPDDYVRLEIRYALAKDVPIIPVLLESTRMPAPGELPEDIRALAMRNAMYLSDMSWDDQVNRLVKALNAVLPRRPKAAPTDAAAAGAAAGPRGADPVRRAGPPSARRRAVLLVPLLAVAGLVLALALPRLLAGEDDPEVVNFFPAGTGAATNVPVTTAATRAPTTVASGPASTAARPGSVRFSFIDRLSPGQVDADVTVTVNNQPAARLVVNTTTPTASKELTIPAGVHNYTLQVVFTTVENGVRQRWTAIGAGTIDIREGSSFEPKYGFDGKACFCPL